MASMSRLPHNANVIWPLDEGILDALCMTFRCTLHAYAVHQTSSLFDIRVSHFPGYNPTNLT